MEGGSEDISLDEFKEGIPKQRVLVLKIITFALVGGPTLFAVIAGVLKQDSRGDQLQILQSVNLGFAVLAFILSKVIPGVVLRSKIQGQGMGMNNVEIILNRIQGAHIMKIALLEGAALFGCVCVLLGLGYINYLSLVPLYIIFITNIPSEKMILRQFIIYFKKDPRLLVEIDEY